MKFITIFLITFSINIFSQSWQIVGQMPIPVSGGEAVVHDSLIYILGGFSESKNTILDIIQEYNPRTNTWKMAGKMQYPRVDFVAGNYADSIVYLGGISSQSPEAASLESWNFSSYTFVLKTNNYFNRLYSTGQIIGNNIYVFGGTAIDTNYPYMYSYDLSTENITHSNDTLFTLTYPTQQMSAVYNNYIYLFGGARGVLLKTIYKYDISNNTMVLLSNGLERPRAGGAAVLLQNKIFIIGGFDETNSALSSVLFLRVGGGSSEIEDGPGLNYARRDPIAVNYFDSIYVFGGIDVNGHNVSSVEMYSNAATTVVNKENITTPTQFILDNNYPNPFNPSTQIRFEVAKQSRISIDIFSILGRHIKNLTSKMYDPGKYSLTWNGTDTQGELVSSGIYIYMLSSNYFSESKKMVLLK
jgi:N-acetylneuraminic acid mutarotase